MSVVITAMAMTLLVCPEPSPSMMALDLNAFDQTEQGWRSLDERGCEAATADVIVRYRTDNATALAGEDLSTLIWHEAQLRAAAGQTHRALDLMSWSRDLEEEPVIQLYIDASMAFLRRDRPGIEQARSRMLAVPVPEGFARAIDRFKANYPDVPPPVWPLNLDVVDGLIACFDRPYAEAYACRPERSQ